MEQPSQGGHGAPMSRDQPHRSRSPRRRTPAEGWAADWNDDLMSTFERWLRPQEDKVKAGASDDREQQPETSEALAVTDDTNKRDVVDILPEDIPFISGKECKTIAKISRVSGAELRVVEQDKIVEICGNPKQRRLASRYVRYISGQRTGCVELRPEDTADHCTIVQVPKDAIGFVTGKGGNFLRTMEDEHCVIMFFPEIGSGKRFDKAQQRSHERLVIFGERKGRRGAQLDVMSAVECKMPGVFTDATLSQGILYDEGMRDDDWGTFTLQFSDDDICFALGRKGMTRRKLERASGCLIRYVRNTAFFSGTRLERWRADDYMRWIFAQLDGPFFVDTTGRKDCTELEVPKDFVGYCYGTRREMLIRMEDEWGVLMFFTATSRHDGDSLTQRLIILGPIRCRTGAMLEIMRCVENMSHRESKYGYFARGVREKTSRRRKFDTERAYVHEGDLPYALGRGGVTMKKLAKASGAILQFVGHVAWIAGVLEERNRCKEYLGWLLANHRGRIIVDTRGRADVTEVHVPESCTDWVMGDRGCELHRVEQESDTFCFAANDHQGYHRLCVFGHDAGSKFSDKGRMKAERLLNELIHEGLRQNSSRRSPSQESDSLDWGKK